MEFTSVALISQQMTVPTYLPPGEGAGSEAVVEAEDWPTQYQEAAFPRATDNRVQVLSS